MWQVHIIQQNTYKNNLINNTVWYKNIDLVLCLMKTKMDGFIQQHYLKQIIKYNILLKKINDKNV